MEFGEAFEGPIVETINGKEISFPRLVIDDYTKWIAELTAARRKKSASLIPADAGPGERHQMLQQANGIEVGLEVISGLVWTVPGSKRVLDLSMAKSGIAVEDRPALFKAIPPFRFHALAADVSALFEQRFTKPKPAPAPATGQPDPNSVSPAEAETDGDTTGSGIE